MNGRQMHIYRQKTNGEFVYRETLGFPKYEIALNLDAEQAKRYAEQKTALTGKLHIVVPLTGQHPRSFPTGRGFETVFSHLYPEFS